MVIDPNDGDEEVAHGALRRGDGRPLLIRGSLPEQRPPWVARYSTPELKGIAWQATRVQCPVVAKSAEDCANRKPDLGLDAGVLQAEVGTELGLSNWSPLPLVRPSKAHWLALPGCLDPGHLREVDSFGAHLVAPCQHLFEICPAGISRNIPCVRPRS